MPGGHVGKVYQSVRGVVQGTLHRRKPDIMVSIRAKDDDGHLNDAMQELEKIFVDRIGGLKAAFSDNQAVVASKAQHAEQVSEGLKANITALEAKLRETEDALHRKDIANQKMEESLSTEIRDLQSVVKQKEEALKSRDSEVNDLKSNRDVLAEQITRLELVIQQAKGEAASKAQHAEQVIEGLKAKIATLQPQLTQTEQIVVGTDCTMTERDTKVSNRSEELRVGKKQKEEALKSQDYENNERKCTRDVRAEQIAGWESAIQQAKGEAASKAQHAEQVIEGLKAKIATLQPQLTQTEQIVVGTDCTMTGRDTQVINLNAELKSRTNGINKVAGAMSVATEAVRKTVSQDAFAHMTAEFSKLTNVMGNIASLIVRHHVRALGESMEAFPQTRLTQLLDSLSGQITDDKLKADFRKRFGKV